MKALSDLRKLIQGMGQKNWKLCSRTYTVTNEVGDVLAECPRLNIAEYIVQLDPQNMNDLIVRLENAEAEVRRKQRKAENHVWVIVQQSSTSSDDKSYYCGVDDLGWSIWNKTPKEALHFANERSALIISPTVYATKGHVLVVRQVGINGDYENGD